MTKQEILSEIADNFGTVLKVIDNQESTEGVNWYKAVYFDKVENEGNLQAVNFYVLREGTKDEEAVYQKGAKPKETVTPPTEEEIFEKQVVLKLTQLKIEEEAKKRLTV